MESTGNQWKRRALRALLFSLASGATSYAPLALAQANWTPGQSPGAAYVFWISSGMNVAGLLILGWRYAPVILLNALPYHLLLGIPAAIAWAGTVDDMIQALVSWWILHRIGRYEGHFGNTRVTLALLLAAVVSPLPGALFGTLSMVDGGNIAPARYWKTVANWIFGAGAGILMLTPLITTVWRRRGWRRQAERHAQRLELAGCLAGCLACAVLTFHTVLHSGQSNFSFLIFPFVIFAAIRLGPDGAATTLGCTILALYLTLLRHNSLMSSSFLDEKIWFLQAFYWVLAITGLVVSALARERREAEKRLLVEQNLALEDSWREESARLDALRYQLQPHFLFNTLNSIRATLPLNAAVPREMLTDLGDFLRSTLSQPASGHMVPLVEEIESLERYLTIEKRRFGDDLMVTIRLDPATTGIPVPILLLQPLVENAVQHGLQTTSGQLRLQVSARLDGSRLLLQVANSGSWIETPADKKRRGVGLENIHRRIALLYGDSASLTRTLDPDRVSMTITLPLSPQTHDPLPHR